MYVYRERQLKRLTNYDWIKYAKPDAIVFPFYFVFLLI